MLYTCLTCGRITTEDHCPAHSREGGDRSRNRDRRKQDRFRKAVLERDGYRCRHCGSTDDLRACHWPRPLRAYRQGDPAAYDPAHGITLCRQCDKATDRYASKRRY